MATKIIRYSQEVNPGNAMDANYPKYHVSSPTDGDVQVSFIPVGTSKFCGLKSTISDCLWTSQSSFRSLFAKEIYKVIRHVRTPSLTIVLQHKTLGGELLTVQYRITSAEMDSIAGIPPAEDGSDHVFDMCLEITDRMVLQLIDGMSSNIKPSYHTVSNYLKSSYNTTQDCSVPSDMLPNDLAIDGTAMSPLQSKIDDIKTDVDYMRNKMMETASVPADRMNQDYATAKDIIDGKFDKYLGKDKKKDKSKTCEDSMFQSSKTSWI